MAGPEIRVLGPLYMSIDGQEAPLGTPMQRAVLGRLIVAHGQAVSTERLIEDLWAGHPPSKASSVLQVHIHNLRRLFEPDRPRRAPSRHIVSESSGYALRIAENAVDAWHFEEQLRAYQELISNPETRPTPLERNTMLEAMLTQWRGPALEAFADIEWAAPEAHRLDDLHLTAIELDAQAKLELGRWGEVVIGLRGLFGAHPGREELVRLLAIAQYQLGQQLEALNTIRRSREFLGDEFGVDPGPALRHLETAILTHSADLTPLVPAAEADDRPVLLHSGGSTTPAETPSATGYAAELSELLTLAAATRSGGLRLVWMSGEAGIGKTTLAETALAALTTTGWTVATGDCPEIDGAPPAWAWSEIHSGLEAATAAPISTVPGPDTDADDAFTLSRKLAQSCRNAAASGPVALLLEDVHRADTATLQVLRQVVNWLREEPVLVLVTMRRSEAGPVVHNTAAALAQYTAAALELNGLDLAGTRQTAQAAGLPTLSDDVLAQLHARTGGNPLFVRELAKLLAAHGSLEQVPESIRDLIDNRVAQLPAGVTAVLQHISIWGAGSELGILSLAAGLPKDTLIDLIAAAEAAGLVGSGRTGTIAFEHALIRDAVYLGIPALRRGRMHWAALELLEEHAEAYPALARDPEVLARHAILGASAETARTAIELVRAAARRRMDRRMRSETVRLLRAAVELHELAGDAADHADRADRTALLDTRCTLVTALAYDNQHRAARAERARALTLAEDLGGENLRIRALTCWRAPAIWAAREWGTPDHRIRQALARALAPYRLPTAADQVPGAALDVGREASPGGLRTTIAVAETAVGQPLSKSELVWLPGDAYGVSEDRSPESLILLLIAATFEAGLDEYAGGQRLALQAVRLARSLGDPELRCAAINAATYLEFDYGPEFAALAAELEQVATGAGLAEYQALAQHLGYRAAVAHADLREAARRAVDAVEYADEGQLQPLLDMVSCLAATMELLRGDIDLSEQLYERFGRRIARSGATNVAEVELFCATAIGWARGDLSGLVERLAEMYTELPSIFGQAYSLALVHAGKPAIARPVYAATDRVREEMYPVLMSAMRARTAIALGETADIRALFEYLAPHSGTVIGIESGTTAFGPMDAVLAELAEALGDRAAAAEHRERARLLLERIRTELPVTGDSLLRVA
ncbi:MAG: Transcriptional regulatory protein EmbR [Nocardia sp.]|uniref:BTAD domain-containing putative transcriptional regulator n=1 Tax=Nocardia sp. TaxID=1821 RepID=UPI0026140B2E|nr:BTAD domain-containing putative transcriptional regulator [Nocardia sp.]MCU1642670.1 Transcriptional regulatory protein EmbR [Nocardia sp.]